MISKDLNMFYRLISRLIDHIGFDVTVIGLSIKNFFLEIKVYTSIRIQAKVIFVFQNLIRNLFATWLSRVLLKKNFFLMTVYKNDYQKSV